MWRWFVPIGLTVVVTTAHVFLDKTYLSPAHGEYSPGALTGSWILAFVSAAPTILYYRLLIWLGEHVVRRLPLLGAAIAIAAGAIIPPVAHNMIAEWSRSSRNFQSPPPAKAATIAVDQAGSKGWLENGFAMCAEECLRLLYGNVARQVVVGDPTARTAYAPRSVLSGIEAREYPTAHVLRLERRSICPPVATGRSRQGNVPFPGGVLIDSYNQRWNGRGVEDRAIALMAAGHCIVSRPTVFDDADLRLGVSTFQDPGDMTLLPGQFGVARADFNYVEARTGQGWKRLSQHVFTSTDIRWSFPFGFLPGPRSWIAATRAYYEAPSATVRGAEPWRWAGIHLSDVPETDEHQIRRMLQTALEMPPQRPRDARHLLARQYLLRLSSRPIDDIDRALLERLVLDPRVPATELQPLLSVARKPGAPPIGIFLVRRIRLAERQPEAISRLAHLLAELPREQWAAILPEARKLAADAAFAGDASALFELFEAGTAKDAELLLDGFEREWPPRSLADYPHEMPDQLREEIRASRHRLDSYLRGLCALGGDSGVIRARLLEASKTALPTTGSADEIASKLWRTMLGMGVPVEKLAAGRGVGAATGGAIRKLAEGGYRICGSRRSVPVRSSGAASRYPEFRPDYSRALTIDALVLLSLLMASTAIAMKALKQRRRDKITQPHRR